MKRALTYLALTLVAITASGCSAGAAGNPKVVPSFAAPIHATIDYAVDGDTLRVELPDGERPYVRLVGIDTPEDVRPGYPTECGAQAAAASMEALAPDGAPVTLKSDSVADATDRYGRILAHAYINGRQLEIAQLRRGWAYVYRYDNQRFDGLPRFERAELHARHDRLGVWGQCGGDFHSAEPGDQN